MAYLGIYFYIINLYIRPQDWMAMVYQYPVDYFIFGIIIITGLWKLKDLPEVFRRPQTRFFFLWLLWIPITGIANGVIDQSIDQFIIYLKFFMFYICAALYVDTLPKLKWLIIFIIFVTGVLVVQGIYQWNTGVGWAGQTLGYTDSKGLRIRWIGLWDGYNVLCLLFVVGMAFILQFCFKPWVWSTRLIAIGMGGLTLYGIYLTKSRGGLIALVGVVAFYFNDIVKSKLIKVAALGTLIFVIFVGVATFGGVDDKEHSASKRVAMWGEGLEMLKHNPFFGIGKGEFLGYSHSLIAHNSFVEVFGETGMVGFFLWMGLNYVSVRGIWLAREGATDPRVQAIGTGFISCLLGYLFVSFFITTEFELLYFLHALSGSYINLTGIKVPFTGRDTKFLLGLMASIIVLVYLTTVFYF